MINPKTIPKPQLHKIISIAINEEIEELLKEVEFRVDRINKLAAEIQL